MEVVRDSLYSLAAWLFSMIREMVVSLWNDPSYRSGFAACFLTIVVVGVLQQIIGWAWALIQAFFGHTAAPPAPGMGPTPVGLTGGCVQGAVVLSILTLALVALVFALFTGGGSTP